MTRITKYKITLSSIIVSVVSFMSITPFTTLIYANILDSNYIILTIIYWLVLLFFFLFINRKDPKKINFKFNNYNIDDSFALIIGISSILLVLFISWKYTGLRINFNLDAVYELRNESRTYNLPAIVQRLFFWSRSINILLLTYYIYKKKYPLAFLFFISQILSFGIDGLKTTLFTTILTIIMCFVFTEKLQEKAYNYILYGITSITVLGILENVILKSSAIIDIVIRRMMIVPVYLSSCYVRFFSYNQPDYFRRSIFKIFGIDSQYNDLEFTIGEVFFNKPLMRCNNGLISEAITNFGTIGVIIGPILLILVLRFMDRCTYGLNKKIIIVMGVYFGLRLLDTFLSVGMISHGFFITIIMMMMLRNKRENKND